MSGLQEVLLLLCSKYLGKNEGTEPRVHLRTPNVVGAPNKLLHPHVNRTGTPPQLATLPCLRTVWPPWSNCLTALIGSESHSVVSSDTLKVLGPDSHLSWSTPDQLPIAELIQVEDRILILRAGNHLSLLR